MRYTFTFLILCCLLLAHTSSDAQTGWKWGRKNTGRGGMTAWPSAVDASGNLYLAGSTYGSAFIIDSMVFGTHTVYSSGPYNQMIVTKIDSAGNYLWAIGSQGTHVGVTSLATDPAGNILIVGNYSGSSVMLGAITLSNSGTYSMFFIAKISSSGTVLWAQNILTNHGWPAPVNFGIGVDGAGNSYVTGNFYQYMLLFGSTILTNHDATGFTGDIVLLKYNAAGTIKWAKSFGGNHTDYPFIQSNYAGVDYSNNMMSVTPAGHIYLTGLFYSDSIQIGGTTLYNPYGGTTEPGPTYSYLCKWDSNGNAMWAKHVERKMLVNEIISNSREEVFFTGQLDSADTWGSFTLNPGAVTAKLDSAGNLVWARTDAGGDGQSIGVDDSGKVFVTGLMRDSMSFGSYVLHAPAVHTAPMFVARYDSLGNYVNSLSVADGAVVSCAIRPDHTGSFYLVGNFFGTPLTFGPDVLDTAGILSETAFIAKYKYVSSATTAVQWPIHNDNILIFPNPANNMLTIKAPEKIHTVYITDICGKNVYSANCDNELLYLDILGIPAGDYLVRINNSIVRKFVKE